MSAFILLGLVIAVAVGAWLSRFSWSVLLALVPVAMLVPAYYGAGTICGAGFFMRLTDEAAQCANGISAGRTFSAAYMLAFPPVLISAVLGKLWRMLRARKALG